MSSCKTLVICTGGIKNDGITSWIKQIFSYMDLSDLQVDIIGWQDSDRLVIDSIRQLGLHVRQLPNRRTSVRAYAKALYTLMRDEKYDVVHACGSSAIMALELGIAKHAGVPMRIAHSRNTVSEHASLDKMLRPLFYHYVTDRYACGTDAGRWLFGNRSFTVIPNGKDLRKFAFSADTRNEVRQELGFTPNQIVIGHVGRFNIQKNHAKLIEAFAELHARSSRYALCLIGDGELQKDIQDEVSKLGLSDTVKFLGRRTDVSRLLNAMDCMVFPSRWEGFPNVVMEWQINGLPVVMSDAITDECAITLLVSQVSLQSSSKEWADEIEHSLRNRSRVEDSANAVTAAKEKGYDINGNAAMLRNLYLEGRRS